MKILIAIEPRSYGQVVGNAIEKLRPRLEVVVVEPEDLVPEAERLRPELLFSHLRGPDMPTAEVQSWVEISVEPDRASTASVNGEVKEIADLDLDGLLSLVDEAEKYQRERASTTVSADAVAPHSAPPHAGRPKTRRDTGPT